MARSMIARQNIKLNLVPGGVPPVLNVSQYDSAYDVHFTIYNGAQLFEIPDDVSIQFQETKRDGNGFAVGATKSAQTGQCYIWMQEQMSAVPGDQICELVLTNTTEDQIGTANFIMRVEPAALNKNTVISESEIAYANQVLAQLGSVAAYKAQLDAQGNEIDQLNTDLAAEVAARQAADNTLQSNINSEASTRATADASLQSQINQLIAPSGSAPSAAEVENARVGADGTVYSTLGDAIRGQVTDVKSAISEITGNTPITMVDNQYINLSGTTITMSDGVPQSSGLSPYYNYGVSACTEGDKFTINGTGGNQTRLWAFVSSTGEILSKSDASSTANNLVVEAPANSAFIIIHTSTSDERVSYVGEIVKVNIDNLNEVSDFVMQKIRIADVLDWRLGTIAGNTGADSASTTRIRTNNYIKYNPDCIIEVKPNVKVSLRAYNANGGFLWSSISWILPQKNTLHDVIVADGRTETNVAFLRIVAAYSDDRTITSFVLLGDKIHLYESGDLATVYASIDGNTAGIYINATGLGNCAIRCAKEQSYVDGTPPVIEWYLLEEPVTHRFYYSTDLQEKKYLFTFPYDAYKYSFGVLQNGDIIACLDPDSIAVDNKSDSNRVNPYVFLASENWTICHEVDFGSNLKPCGWASNQGFKVLANGDACWCEYTRQTTYTANVWKLTGNPLDYTNWVVTKSFVVTSTDNSTLFKHCHNIMQDFYTGVCYLSTGDDNIGSMMFASTDNCDTWVQLVSPDSDGQVNQYGYINGSEKYCRMAMMTFTADYIYWASDTPNESIHYLFRAERGSNGILDYATIVDLVNLPSNNGASSYGTALITELNAIMLLERCDTPASEMLMKLVDLGDNSLITIGTLYGANNATTYIGFRCRFTEWYPVNGLIHFGFDLNVNRHNNAVNHIKGFGNTGATNDGAKNINNLAMQVYKNGDGYGFAMHTFYV